MTWIKNLQQLINDSYKDFLINLKNDDYEARSRWINMWYYVGELDALIDVLDCEEYDELHRDN